MLGSLLSYSYASFAFMSKSYSTMSMFYMLYAKIYIDTIDIRLNGATSAFVTFSTVSLLGPIIYLLYICHIKYSRIENKRGLKNNFGNSYYYIRIFLFDLDSSPNPIITDCVRNTSIL